MYHFYTKSRARSANADNKTVAEALPATAGREAGEGTSFGFLQVVPRRGLRKGSFWHSLPFYMFKHCFSFFNHNLILTASVEAAETRVSTPTACSIFKNIFIVLKAPGHHYHAHLSALLIHHRVLKSIIADSHPLSH